MKVKKLLTWAASILGVILLGAIGSGVWSEILSPTLSWLIDIVVRSIAILSVRFKDAIYAKAAQGYHESVVLMIYPCIACVVFFAYFWFVEWSISSFRILRLALTTKIISPKKSSKTISEKTISNLVGLNVLAVALLLIFTISWIRTSYASRVSIQSFNSLNIVAPFIEQQEYLSLKSDFLRIKNSNDYDDFYRKVVELSKKHQIELPLFKPL